MSPIKGNVNRSLRSHLMDTLIRIRDQAVRESFFNHVSGITFMSMVFGLATSSAREKGKPFLLFFNSAMDIVMILMAWLMR